MTHVIHPFEFKGQKLIPLQGRKQKNDVVGNQSFYSLLCRHYRFFALCGLTMNVRHISCPKRRVTDRDVNLWCTFKISGANHPMNRHFVDYRHKFNEVNKHEIFPLCLILLCTRIAEIMSNELSISLRLQWRQSIYRYRMLLKDLTSGSPLGNLN